MAKLDVQKARDLLQGFDFGKLFVEELGWSQPTSHQRTYFGYKDDEFQRKQIAQLSGVVVLEITTSDGKVPDKQTLAAIHKEISKLHHENLLIFVDSQRTQSLWYWVKREDGKLRPREHLYVKGQPGDLFLSKLSSMVFDMSEFDESGNVSVVTVAQRLKDALDVQRVTKKFFREYDDERLAFLDLIQGIDDERQRRWYASVLLNRLMFIYFLQRKGFIDEGNQGYLQMKLEACQKQFGKDEYYKTFLRPLFFEGFAKPEQDRSSAAKKLLGKIKYLNGGLFLPHRVELDNPNIRIPDKAFENLLKLFQSYSWNLNDTPGGEDNEINPDVLGYIFEKYINQKAFGAYYTRPEITEYLCEQTIYKLILEKINSPGLPGVMQPRSFDSMSELLLNLDAQLCRELLNNILPDLSLLDPACGSGAFLVAAMKTLVNIYAAVIGKIQFLSDHNLSEWLRRAQKDHPSVSYFIKKCIITDNLYGVDIMDEATEIARLRLFLALVSSAESVDQLEPLPNIDFNILKGNSLIGLMHVDDREFDARQAQGHLFRKSYRELLAEKNRLVDLYRHTGSYTDDLRSMRDNIETKKREATATLDEILLTEFQKLGISFEQATWDDAKKKEGKTKKRPLTIKDVEALEPFHWGYEFDEIINRRGGFDAIIANPPWEVFKPQAKEFFAEHSDLVTKNKMTIKEFEKEQSKLLRNPEIRSAWLEYQSRFPHLSLYFRKTPQYKNQISVINGKKAGTDINLYKLFLERIFSLLRQGGRCGMLLPTGIYNDLGTKQLREMLFSQSTLGTLFGLSNERFIFEGVHHSFKICLLNFAKGSQSLIFRAAFRITPEEAVKPEDLDFFLNDEKDMVEISVAMVRRLSPDSLSVLEFKNDRDPGIVEKMASHPLLGSKSGSYSWSVQFTREVNNMSDMKYIADSALAGYEPLYEGKNINQFDHAYEEPRYFIRVDEYNRDNSPTLASKYPSDFYRLCFRRQARATDKHTFIGTVAPKRALFFDNLGYVKPFDQSGPLITHEATLFLLACMNSYALQFVLRQQLNTNLSFYLLYQLPVPRLAKMDHEFSQIVERVARLVCISSQFDDLAQEVGLRDHKDGVTNPTDRARLRAELDGMIAHLYGLTEAEFTHILSTFPLVEQSVKNAALDAYREFAPKSSDQEVAALIAKDESSTLEFKSSARWDFNQGKQSKTIEDVVVKTVAAFLNTDGGDLIIGADDEHNVIGLSHDYKLFGKKDKRDAYWNFLTTLLLDHLGKDKSDLIKIGIHDVGGKDVARIAVKASPKPVFVKEDKYEHLYIRAGNSTRLLTTKEAIDYCQMHWS